MNNSKIKLIAISVCLLFRSMQAADNAEAVQLSISSASKFCFSNLTDVASFIEEINRFYKSPARLIYEKHAAVKHRVNHVKIH
jgi:hypothetical protein